VDLLGVLRTGESEPPGQHGKAPLEQRFPRALLGNSHGGRVDQDQQWHGRVELPQPTCQLERRHDAVAEPGQPVRPLGLVLAQRGEHPLGEFAERAAGQREPLTGRGLSQDTMASRSVPT
jgi:hypothetical protein